MQSQEFVSAYNRDFDVPTAYHGELAEVMEPAIHWSRMFGHMLHNYLRKGDVSADLQEDFQLYQGWIVEEFPAIERMVSAMDTTEGYSAYTELNFHRLNSSMALQWAPLLYKDYEKVVKPIDRAAIVRFAQDSVALRGLKIYSEREKIASQKADFAYFSKAQADRRSDVEGILNESDAAIALLGMLYKHPRLTVVPAPAQFEHGQRSNVNADFVVLSRDRRAMGIQVKTAVTGEKAKEYDPSRIVLVDARVDFGNELAKRTSRKHSDAKLVSWAGMICAHHTRQISSNALLAIMLQSQTKSPKAFININKHLAYQLTRDIKPNLMQAVQRISERVLPHVEESQVA
jgi:hypothetical protein